MPSALATTSRACSARQARPVRERCRLTLISSASAAKASSTKYQPMRAGQRVAADRRRVDDDAGRQRLARLVFAAEIDDDEVQPERADGEIEAAQPQRRQAEHQAEEGAEQRRGRQRHPERRARSRAPACRPYRRRRRADPRCRARSARQSRSAASAPARRSRRAAPGWRGRAEMASATKRQRDQHHKRDDKADASARVPSSARSCV